VQQNMQININENYSIDDATARRGTGEVRFVGVETFDIFKNKSNEFFQHDSVSFKLKIKIIEPVKELMASIAFRSGRTRDIVTSTAKINIDTEGKIKGDIISIDINFPKINLRPGVYETYYWLGSSNADSAYDVIDNLMPPIVIGIHPNSKDIFTSGYFDDNFTFQQNKN